MKKNETFKRCVIEENKEIQKRKCAIFSRKVKNVFSKTNSFGLKLCVFTSGAAVNVESLMLWLCYHKWIYKQNFVNKKQDIDNYLKRIQTQNYHNLSNMNIRMWGIYITPNGILTKLSPILHSFKLLSHNSLTNKLSLLLFYY